MAKEGDQIMPVFRIETNQTLSEEQTLALMEKSTEMKNTLFGWDGKPC